MRPLTHYVCFIFVALLVTLGVSSVDAALTGSVYGTIEDSDGNPIKGVTVLLVNETNPQGVQTVTTNKKGRFRFVQIVPGTYKISATMETLKPVTYDRIRISTNGRVKVNFKLFPADLATELVSGPAAQSSPAPEPTSGQAVPAPKLPDTGIKNDTRVGSGL